MDCIIVCGYPAYDDGRISNVLKNRIDKAIELYISNNIKYLIVSGGAVKNEYKEAIIMYNYCLSKGIREENILIEDKAISTYHNMMYCKELMDKYRLNDCYVVTSSWHIVKAKYYARKFNLKYTMVACSNNGTNIFKVIALTIYMPINMLINRMKGFK